MIGKLNQFGEPNFGFTPKNIMSERCVSVESDGRNGSKELQLVTKGFTESTDHISGWMLKTVQSAGLLTRSKFIKRFYHLDKKERILRIFNIKGDQSKLKQELNLKRHTVCWVRDGMKKRLEPSQEA